MGSNTDITAGNFTKKDVWRYGYDSTWNGYTSFRVLQTDDGGKTTVRLSDQSGKVLTIIKKESRADKGFEAGRIL